MINTIKNAQDVYVDKLTSTLLFLFELRINGCEKMVYIDEETEKENMLMDIPLTDELKKKNPQLYERIKKLKYGDE